MEEINWMELFHAHPLVIRFDSGVNADEVYLDHICNLFNGCN